MPSILSVANGIVVFSPGSNLPLTGLISMPASEYINWGTSLGSAGYGIRDNAGVMEFKNSSGAWASLASTSPTGVNSTFISSALGIRNVKDFGAVGDGVADDTAAITAANTAAVAANTYLFFPAGTYLTTVQTWTAGVRTRWVGAGRNNTKLKSTGGSGQIVSATWSHLGAEWYSELSNMTLDGNSGAGPILSWISGTLCTLRDVALTNVTGTALNLSTMYDSHFANVYVETCGDSTHPCVTLNSVTADALNNCHFYNLHIEPGNRDAILLDFIGTGTGIINANVFYGLKVHGDPATGNPNRPVLRLGANANSNTFFGGIVAYGRSTSQIEVTGDYNTFYNTVLGIGAPVPATGFDLIGGRNRVISPTFQNGTYSVSLIRNSGGIENVIFAPEYGSGTLFTVTGGQYRIEYRDVATSLWVVTDSQGQQDLKLADGTAALPSFTFANEATTGLFRAFAGGYLGIASIGTSDFLFGPQALYLSQNGSLQLTSGATNGTVELRLRRSGTKRFTVDDGAAGAVTHSVIGPYTTTVGFADPTDLTKILGLSLAGMTTAKTLTLSSGQTTTQTLTIPNIRQAETLAVKPQTYTTLSTPKNPTGTTNTSGLMMGLAGAITPQVTGNIRVTVCGNIANGTGGDGAKVQLRMGTGGAPANAGALAGTVYGGQQIYTVVVGATDSVPFSLSALVTGLTVGTAYWIDVDLAAITGGTATISNVAIDAFEL